MLRHIVLEDRKSRIMPLTGITMNLNDILTTDISQRTVRRALKEQGIKCHPAAVKPFISKKNAAKRVAWCKERLDWKIKNWEKICWSDESSVEIQGTGTRRVIVRRLKGERYYPDCLAPSFKSGRESVMVWGCFQGNKLGPLALCPKGRMNSTKYCSILEEHFIPFWNNLDYPTIFMQDGAPPHTSNYTKNWQEKHEITSVEW